MRRVIVLTVLTSLLLSTGAAVAQEYKQAFRFEIKGGMVSSHLRSNNYQDTGVGWGWTAGGGLFLPLFTRYFGVQAEALYVNKDFRIRTTSDPTGGPGGTLREYNFKVNYVEIPLMAHLALSDRSDLRFYLLAGGAIALRTTAKVEFTGDNDQETEEDLEGLANYEWSPVFGIGLRGGQFLLEVRFNLGLKNLGEENSAVDTKVNTSSFLVGLSF